MKERFIEIRFYYYILKLLSAFKYSVSTLDIIEAYCNEIGRASCRERVSEAV